MARTIDRIGTSIARTLAATGMVLGLVIGGVPVAAQATLIAADDPALGTNALVLDTATGLDWLNFRFTTNRSTAQVEADLLPGGPLAEFRYAQLGEVCDLLDAASLTCGAGSSFDVAAGQDFIQLFSFPVVRGVGAGLSNPLPELDSVWATTIAASPASNSIASSSPFQLEPSRIKAASSCAPQALSRFRSRCSPLGCSVSA